MERSVIRLLVLIDVQNHHIWLFGEYGPMQEINRYIFWDISGDSRDTDPGMQTYNRIS